MAIFLYLKRQPVRGHNGPENENPGQASWIFTIFT